MDRRDALKLLGAVPVAVGFTFETEAFAAAAAHAAKAAGTPAKGQYAPKFFNPDEWQLVRVLVDMIIPKDERSGAATDAGVPEFMDFLMNDPTDTDLQRERRQTAMRGGLAWINNLSMHRFGKGFVEASEQERCALLDDIAYIKEDDEEAEQREPRDLRPRVRTGPTFFTSFRDLTAAGFWSSKMGVDDLGYVGNRFVPEWKGAPPEVLARLGLPPEK